MKFYSEKLGNHLAITGNYNTNNKKVILKQISPYRTDFYVSPEGNINLSQLDIKMFSIKKQFINLS